jgi:putative transposase
MKEFSMKKIRHTNSQILSILKQNEMGKSVPDLCREHGMSSACFYQWRSKYGGMDASLMKRIKELKEENRRLKKMYAEERFMGEIAREALEKKWQSHLMSHYAVAHYQVSIRLSCKTFYISETCCNPPPFITEVKSRGLSHIQ